MAAAVHDLEERRGTDARKAPPHSVEAEEAVIGACMIDGSTVERVGELIGPADFYREGHRRIFAAILDLAGKQEPIELLTVADRLKARGELAEIGGAAHLADILERVPTAANARYYAEIVRREADRRRAIALLTEASLEIYESGAPLGEYLPDRLAPVFDMLNEAQATPTLSQLVGDSLATMEAQSEGRGPALISTGLLDLDHLLGGGWMPGNFSVLAGRTSMGKSSAMDTSAIAAARRGVQVGVVSIEQRAKLCINRLIAKLAAVPLQRIITGHWRPEEYQKLTRAAEELSAYPIQIRDQMNDWRTIQLTIRRMVNSGVRLVFIDHLHLITLPGRDPESQKLSQVTREIAELAKRLDVPLVVLAQINRDAERDKDHRPRMSQLRACGTIEQDADDIILLYRPGYYDPKEDQTRCEAIVAKQRNGPTGSVDLKFHAETTLFTDWFDADQRPLFERQQH